LIFSALSALSAVKSLLHHWVGLDSGRHASYCLAAMKTSTLTLICAGAVLSTTLSFVRADPPPSGGKVLVLEGDRTLEGEVERVGDQYRVRRSVGETWLPASCVLRLCADTADALNYLRGRTNLDDPDERLRLAQWCIDRGMQEQALVEVRAAMQMRPGHAASKHLLERLQQQPVPNATPANTALPPGAEGEAPAAVDLTVETLAQFTTKIQPILMNTCAGCHAMGRGGSFKLTRVSDAIGHNRKAVQQNLAAVIGQVNPQQPQHSRLLTKAVSLHGNMDKAPPLPNRQAPAYRALEEWVRLTVENNPQLQEHVVALPPPVPPPPHPANSEPGSEPKPGSGGFASEQRREPPPMETAPKPITGGQPPGANPTTPLKRPEDKTPAADPTDPYDPNEFNRQEHPERMKPPKKPA
jgi:hypothetical protein